MKKTLLLVTVLTVLLVVFTACNFLLDEPSVDPAGTQAPVVETKPVATEPAGSAAPNTEAPEPSPTETASDKTHAVETSSVETSPVETAPVETAPVETAPVETAPVETAPDVTSPVETAPVETAPVETAPVETAPDVTSPAETKPIETPPVETKPVEPDPVDTTPAETAPAQSEPQETAPVEAETPEADHAHVWSDWQTAKEATCSDSGERKRTCTCGEYELETLATVDHDYVIHGDTVCDKEQCKLFHSCRFCDFSLLIPLEERYFFLQLSKEQQENVLAVYKALLGCEADFINLPNTMTNAVEDSAEISSFLYYCCPELVQLSTNDMTRWWRADDELKFQLIMTRAEYEAYCVALFDFLVELNVLTCDMTDWEKSKFVYDLIIDRTTYEAQTSDAVNPHEGSSLGPLLVGRARCQGYSNAYQLCMWAVGLECYMITGVAGPDNIPHSWNITNFDGNYYWSDVTWDDREGSATLYTYFHVSTHEFSYHTTDAIWDDWNIPACDSMDMSYFAVNDCYVEAEEDAEAEFLRILDAYYGQDNTIYIKFEKLEQFEAILDEATLDRLVRAWVNKHGISLSWGISYWPDARIMYLELSY